jgi:hypothetical protein
MPPESINSYENINTTGKNSEHNFQNTETFRQQEPDKKTLNDINEKVVNDLKNLAINTLKTHHIDLSKLTIQQQEWLSSLMKEQKLTTMSEILKYF